jgi:hypothetical protein
MEGFKFYFERELKSSKPEDYFSAVDRELGIKPDQFPEYFLSGPVYFPEEGLYFNQAVWKIIKPVYENDLFVRLKYHKSDSPNLNSRAYRKDSSGEMHPYPGDVTGAVFLMPMDKFCNLITRGQLSKSSQSGFGGFGGIV